MGWGILVALVVSFLIFCFLFHVLRRIGPMILHGLLGLACFWTLGYFGVLGVPIDILTFLIAAFGGVLGVLAVIALSYLGIPL